MFSSITIASSTTRPIASTNASSVSVLIEKPKPHINASAPISAIGIVTNGTSVARQLRRNRKITNTTSAIASRIVTNTRSIDCCTKIDESKPMSTRMPSGSTLFSFDEFVAQLRARRRADSTVDCLMRPSPIARSARRARHVAHEFRTNFDARDVAEAHEITAGVFQDDLRELRRRLQIGFRQHREFAVAALDAAGRHLDVLFGQRVFDVGRRQDVRGETRAIEPDAHRIAAFADDQQLRDAGQHFEPVFDDAIGVVGQLHFVVAIGVDRHVDDRRRIRFDLRDDRIVDFLRQETARARHAVAHVVRRGVGIAAAAEAHRYLRLLGAADRTDVVDALDAGDAVFERLRDLRFDDLGVRAEIVRRDRDDRIVDVRKFADRQPIPRDQADQHDDQIHDGREHRPANAEVRENHESFDGARPVERPAPLGDRVVGA